MQLNASTMNASTTKWRDKEGVSVLHYTARSWPNSNFFVNVLSCCEHLYNKLYKKEIYASLTAALLLYIKTHKATLPLFSVRPCAGASFFSQADSWACLVSVISEPLPSENNNVLWISYRRPLPGHGYPSDVWNGSSGRFSHDHLAVLSVSCRHPLHVREGMGACCVYFTDICQGLFLHSVCYIRYYVSSARCVPDSTAERQRINQSVNHSSSLITSCRSGQVWANSETIRLKTEAPLHKVAQCQLPFFN